MAGRYEFVTGATVAADGDGDGAVTSRLHAASEQDLTLCGRRVVSVIREQVNDVAWILGGCKICDRLMQADR
jgi:hypothetical protein